jgi:protein phosphatase 2C family protein 2/3
MLMKFLSSLAGMEDAHATVLNLDGKTGDEKTSFFAVYDGHGG